MSSFFVITSSCSEDYSTEKDLNILENVFDAEFEYQETSTWGLDEEEFEDNTFLLNVRPEIDKLIVSKFNEDVKIKRISQKESFILYKNRKKELFSTFLIEFDELKEYLDETGENLLKYLNKKIKNLKRYNKTVFIVSNREKYIKEKNQKEKLIKTTKEKPKSFLNSHSPFMFAEIKMENLCFLFVDNNEEHIQTILTVLKEFLNEEIETSFFVPKTKKAVSGCELKEMLKQIPGISDRSSSIITSKIKNIEELYQEIETRSFSEAFEELVNEETLGKSIKQKIISFLTNENPDAIL